MIKKLLLASVFTIFLSSELSAQVTIFSEDFETATGQENQATPYIGWQTGDFATTPPTNNNYWWVLDNTRCNVISGNYSMAVSINNPVTTGTRPEYRDNRVASTLVYYTTPIDATNYTNVTLDFNWICEGELFFDFGSVIYSLDGTTWAALPGVYQGQSTTQNVTNLDLSVIDGQQFYLGFAWENDNSVGGFPAFTIDDIDVKGIALTPCTTPNQPTTLNLTPTGDTVFGSFTDAAPVPDNYLVVVSTSATAPTPVNTTTYNIGDTIGAGYVVVDIDNDTNFTATGLNSATTYYLYVFSYNDVCSNGPLYNTINPLNGSTTTTTSTYCTPATNNSPITKYIDDVQFIGTLNDVSNLGSGFSNSPSGYQDWSGLTNSIQAQGEGVNVYVESATGRGRYKAWVDWNKDGVFNNDASEIVYDSAGTLTTTTTFSFVIPANQAIGDYRIRIRFHNAFNDRFGTELGSYNFTACEPFINHDFPGQNNDYTDYGEAEDYLFTVVQSCGATITSKTDGSTCGPGAVTLQVTGSAGTTQFKWYDAETGGNLVATTTGDWSPIISNTTTYWVTADNGSCESLVRTKITGTVNPITTLTITPAIPEICGENDIIQIAAIGSTELAYLIDEDFETGGLGVFTQNNIEVNGAPFDGISQWQSQTSTYEPFQFVWNPAISSGFGANNFVMSTSDSGVIHTENELISPLLDASTFTGLTLELDMYFSQYFPSVPEYVNIEVSTDGGTTWPTIIANITNDVGFGTNFSHLTYDLSAFDGAPSLMVRIYYYADWGDGVAVDNIQLHGTRPLSPSFTWTGTVDAYTDAAATIPYTPGTATGSVYVKPTFTQLQQPTFSFTANATLSNGCTISKDISITNNTKIWNGTQGTTTWNDPNNWYPTGVPTSDNCVIIDDVGVLPDPTILGPPVPPTPSYARNLTIKSNANLELESSTSLTVTDWINVDANGSLMVKNSANLVQVTNVATNNNTGNITMQREVTGLSTSDYVYWSSAVENFGLSAVSPGTSAGYLLDWIPTVGGNGAGNYGEWRSLSENMTPGKGYAIRGLSGTLTPNTAEFIGRPSNGIINRQILRGTYNGVDYPGAGATVATAIDDNWNLVGNPFPSAIFADTFITMNASNIIDDSNPAIAGTVYLWSHQSAPSNAVTDPFYGDFVYNYNPNDYIAYNLTGSTPAGFNGFIGAGQAFFVLMDHTASTTANLVFDNTMRNGVYSNNQFYRNANPSSNDSDTVIVKHRIWLDLIDNNNNAHSILVGYISGATNDKDRLYDGDQLSDGNTLFYSIIDEKSMSIQGRSLPFNNNDIVPLGYRISQNGDYSIAINTVDGLFEDINQNIFLEDTYTNTIHDLRLSPYNFNSNAGTINDRFILRYTDNTLSVDNPEALDGLTIIAPNGKYIKIESTTNPIQNVKVYDLLGRMVIDKPNVNASELNIQTKHLANSAYIVKVTLLNDQQKIQKVVLKQ
ncbi:GEVED domain-containing protein [uncultured Psychroserpens sp.]|uniref:Ig-like domain-containing protein n=1 Tax=uncultured Psychroserpens sp. TaxID=255436 RepID=UPI0026197B70|nr:GEVED domain-containing protein [uncultured Psychroserpens sp.]